MKDKWATVRDMALKAEVAMYALASAAYDVGADDLGAEWNSKAHEAKRVAMQYNRLIAMLD